MNRTVLEVLGETMPKEYWVREISLNLTRKNPDLGEDEIHALATYLVDALNNYLYAFYIGEDDKAKWWANILNTELGAFYNEC